MAEDRLRKLARSIDGLAAKDEQRLRRAQEIAELRKKAAVELHSICAGFVDALNRLVSVVKLEMAPAEFSEAQFRDPGSTLFQINAKGRVVQMEFQATETTISTENFRTPYILEGAVRWYNQELLDRVEILEDRIFYCLDKRASGWHFFDARTQKMGAVNREYLATLLEKLV